MEHTAAPPPDTYISVDVETDGPLPGKYSMLALGMSAIGRYDGSRFERWDDDPESFYAELRPISDEFEPEALQVTGLDRDELARSGRPPAEAMEAAWHWVRELCGDTRPVMVAFPLGFDWLFVQHYFLTYCTHGSPFGHGSALDIKTFYVARSGVVTSRVRKSQLPEALRTLRPHTHNALDDAKEQGELFARLFEWHPEPP